MTTIITLESFIIDEMPYLKVIAFDGRIDESNLDTVKEKIAPFLIDKETFVLLFDFKKLEYINSRVVGYLASIYSQMTAKGGKVFIVSPSEPIQDILKVVGLNSIIEMFHSIEDAINMIKKDFCPPHISSESAPSIPSQKPTITSTPSIPTFIPKHSDTKEAPIIKPKEIIPTPPTPIKPLQEKTQENESKKDVPLSTPPPTTKDIPIVEKEIVPENLTSTIPIKEEAVFTLTLSEDQAIKSSHYKQYKSSNGGVIVEWSDVDKNNIFLKLKIQPGAYQIQLTPEEKPTLPKQEKPTFFKKLFGK